MPQLTTSERDVLRQLHDDVNRSADQILSRVDLTSDAVSTCLATLESLRFVERRRNGKWRISYRGKAYLVPWYQRPVGIVVLGLVVTIVGGVAGGLIVVWLT